MSTITIFVKPGCYQSEVMRFMLTEKGADFRAIDVSTTQGEALVREVLDRVCAPALVDREVILDDLDVIIEYLEDRFPLPAMLPATTTGRAHSRMFFRRMLRDFFPLMAKAEKEGCTASAAKLAAEITALTPIFKVKPFLMSDEIGLMDIGFAPIAHRLHRAKSNLGTPINKYVANIASREAFKKSFSQV